MSNATAIVNPNTEIPITLTRINSFISYSLVKEIAIPYRLIF